MSSARRGQREPPADDAVAPEQSFIQPEQVKKLSGMQSVEDKVDNLCQRIEARDNTEDSGMGWLTYAAIIIGFFVGSLLSGPVGGVTGGGGTPTPIGLVDLTPAVDILLGVI